MERRDFLKRSTAAALALAGLGAVRATPSLAADLSNATHPPHRSLSGWRGGRRGRSYHREIYVRPARPADFHRQSRRCRRHPRHRCRRTFRAGRLYAGDAHDFFGGAQQVSLHAREAGREHEQFAPISQIGTVGQLLAINAKVPAQNLREFIALLKANPGKYHYGSSGLGAIMHLGGELFGFMTETNVVHVPYRGEGAGDGGPSRGPH